MKIVAVNTRREWKLKIGIKMGEDAEEETGRDRKLVVEEVEVEERTKIIVRSKVNNIK